MGKKKGGKAKPAKPKAAEVEVLTDDELVLKILNTALSSSATEWAHGDAGELAAASIVEGLPELRDAAFGGDGTDPGRFQAALDEILGDSGIVELEPGGFDAIARGLQVFQLGLGNPRAVFDTTAGGFEVELFLDQMPVTVSNFVSLANAGFYNGLHVHRIIDGFMAQMGCPHTSDPKAANAGEGAPSPGSTFPVIKLDATFGDAAAQETVTRGTEGDQAGCIPDEFDAARLANAAGTLAMANNDAPSTGGSQFFINTNDNSASLDFWTKDSYEDGSRHLVFGKVIEPGMDVIIGKIGKAKVDDDERPVKAIKIKSVTIS